jgi:hypothetical protein
VSSYLFQSLRSIIKVFFLFKLVSDWKNSPFQARDGESPAGDSKFPPKVEEAPKQLNISI